jgi:hypothetical protein
VEDALPLLEKAAIGHLMREGVLEGNARSGKRFVS